MYNALVNKQFWLNIAIAVDMSVSALSEVMSE